MVWVGSRASRKPSPRKFTDSTVVISASAGNVTIHQMPWGANRPPSAAIWPHAGVGGLTPKPRNDSAASRMIAAPMIYVDCTMIGLIAFGRTWR